MSIREHSRELWFIAPRVVEIQRNNVPTPLPGQVLARALCTGVSQGTEMLLYRGEAPSPFDPSLDTPGQPTYPRRYGYAWVGEVVMGIDDGTGRVASVPPGTRIFSLAPHADYHVFDPLQVATLPPEIPAERAVL
ncbi:MAG: hypothetical protein ACM3ZE_13340 [Myxococcales bacterium]